MPGHDSLHQARELIDRARSIVVLTGAGISAESGISTFRGGMDALWKDLDPQTLATPEAFASDPEKVTRWYDWRRLKCRDAIPNAGHIALAELEQKLAKRAGRFTLLTQNVDRLHQRAGSMNVVELHGTIMAWRCSATDKPVEMPEGPLQVFPLPSPHYAGAFVRPCVVWFGEMLPAEALRAAEERVSSCDLFMSIGTSSLVYPAASYYQHAAVRGAATIEINPQATPASSFMDVSLRARAATTLSALVRN
jgi:NAD-dependent deacetylase